MTQRTVARLSEQLRRYLDDQAWFENRRIMNVIREIEQHALAVRDAQPAGTIMELDEPAPAVDLPMDRPLFTPPVRPMIHHQAIEEGDAALDPDALFDQFHVDKERLRARLRRALQTRHQISLAELLEDEPIEQGLAELVAWLSLATGDARSVIDEERPQTVWWTDGNGTTRAATLPTVVFVSESAARAELAASSRKSQVEPEMSPFARHDDSPNGNGTGPAAES